MACRLVNGKHVCSGNSFEICFTQNKGSGKIWSLMLLAIVNNGFFFLPIDDATTATMPAMCKYVHDWSCWSCFIFYLLNNFSVADTPRYWFLFFWYLIFSSSTLLKSICLRPVDRTTHNFNTYILSNCHSDPIYQHLIPHLQSISVPRILDIRHHYITSYAHRWQQYTVYSTHHSPATQCILHANYHHFYFNY